MSDLLSLQGLLTVVELVTASVLLPPMAWLVAKAWRRSAAGRRLVWITAFAMLLGLPVLALVAPSLAVIPLPAPAPVSAAPLAAAIALAPDPATATATATATVPGRFDWLDLIPIAGAVWLAGLAKLGAQHLCARVRLELMRRKAMPWRRPAPIPVRGCQLLVSEDCPGPMTWGAFRPVIMLPEEALGWPTDRLATVLRHELAHVRRRDSLVQALAVIACAFYWPNPLVWGAARALRREAELAADDAVIASGVLPSHYAGQLLELAAEWRERRLTATGLAMAAPPALSQRVQSILSTDAIRTGATPMDALKLVLLGGGATAALTLARPSVAEVPAPQQAALQAEPASPAPPAAVSEDAVNSLLGHDKVATRHGDAEASAVPDSRARSVVRFAVQDAPAPAAPPAPAAAPAPPAVSVAPAPPPAPAPPRRGDGSAPWTMTWIPNPNAPPPPPEFQGRRLTPEERAELDRKLAAIGPAIDKAIKDAHIEETVRKALSAQDAQTREEVARQLAEIGPKIQRSIAGAQVQLRFAELAPQIEAARRQAQERAAEADERVAAQLEEQARRARERAQRAREQLNAPQPPPAPKN